MTLTMPDTQYAMSGDVHIAYQVFGAGDRNVVMIPGAFSHVELLWETPIVDLFERLAPVARVAVLDKRGTGLSDRNVGVASLEVRMDDARAVMDACAMESASLIGVSEGGPMSLLLSATYPDRIDSLVLYGAAPTWKARPDVPGSEVAEGACRKVLEAIETGFSDGAGFEIFAGPGFDDREFRREVGRRWRNSASPRDATQIFSMLGRIDVCETLPLVTCPTLVIAASEDLIAPAASSRWMVDQMPNARYEELSGYHYCTADPQVNAQFVDLIEEFLTGSLTKQPPTRALSTVLFTDIVSSTELASTLGDGRWRRLLEEHDRSSEQLVRRFRGEVRKATGDGVLATFDGPGRAVACGLELVELGKRVGVGLRVGVHTEEIEIRADGDVTGLAVNLASRVESQARPGEVLVSRTVADLTIGSDLEFHRRGQFELKGVPGTWELFTAHSR